MNCSEFDNVVVEVARSETRGTEMEAASKQQALAHAESCARCATCLNSEKSLSQGLQAVAAQDASLGAPAFVEAALLVAFRQREDARTVPAVVTPVSKESPLHAFFFRMKWALATAAALALIAFAIARAMQSMPIQEPEIADGRALPEPAATEKSEAKQSNLPEPEFIPKEKDSLVIKASAPTRRKATPRRSVNRTEAQITVDVGPFVIDEPETLSAKEFLVFDYARNLPPADSTQLMRVRMPRERLAPLGIPLPRATRNSDYVNADLLVGSDGVPRAIRVANR
jgi:hypothetical protein